MTPRRNDSRSTLLGNGGHSSDEETDFAAQSAAEDVDTPLLATDLPPELVPDKHFQHTVMAMCCVFMALVETYAFLTSAPVQEIMEDFICHGHYPDHAMNQPTIQDQRCKGAEVQKILAMVRSWWQTCQMWVPLLVQIPYGIIADKYGRRPVMFLSLFGVLLEGSLTMLVLLHPQTFTIWAIIPTSLAYLIGGGPPMATAMVWTILCDAIPAVERTAAFYQITALAIVLGAVLNPISAWLMSMDPWLPMWIGIICMVLGTFSALLVPETLRLRKQADAAQHHQSSATSEALLPSDEPQPTGRTVPPKAYARELLFGATENVKHIWRFILASKSVMLLVAACGFFFPVKLAFESFLLQYTTKRFDWSWSTATYYFTTSKVTSLVMLLIVLPAVSRLLARTIGDNPLKRDLYMARGSVIFLILACFFTATAYVPPMLVMSLVFYGISVGFPSQVRALASGVVEPHTLATLNTMISSMEAIMGSIGAPTFGWLMSRGMDIGGAALGLPFLAATVFALFICAFLWLFRIPRAFL